MFLLFTGPDEFSASEELARLRASGEFDLNQDVFDGAMAELASIRTVCETFPFLSARRLVVVQGLPKRKRGGASDDADGDEDDAEPEQQANARASRSKKVKGGAMGPKAFVEGLADCATHLPETTTLVVHVPEDLEASHPLMKAAKAAGQVKTFRVPRGSQLEDWLARRAKAANARLRPDAARELIGLVGEDTRVLASEIEKLCTYVGAGGEIGIEDVRALTAPSREARVFDLTDALARRDRSRALALLHELLANGESPLGIVALTAFQTRALMQVKTLADRGLRVPQIAQTAGLAPFVVEKSLPLARQFTMPQLEAAHRTLLDVDAALKRSRMTPDMALDLLVLGFGTGVR